MLSIRLFGELDIRWNDAPVAPLDSGRSESLLAYLLLHRRVPQSRQHIAFLLWPDSTEPQARTNLRHVLYNLRRALPDLERFLHVTTRTLQWRPDAPFWLDVADFDDAVAKMSRGASDDDVAALRRAITLYRGDLLQASYDEWLTEERADLRRRYIQSLETLVGRLEQLGSHVDAIMYAEILLRNDPLREETYRLLMGLHDARGDHARALRVYHTCAATLERELGIQPDERTRDAYERLLPSGAAYPEASERHGPSPTSVIRPVERARLAAIWRQAEGGVAQFVLLSGEPGVGKTWLVDELRASCAHGGTLTADARSYPAEGALPYAPVVAWLRSEPFPSRITRLEHSRLDAIARLLPELSSTVAALPAAGNENDRRAQLFEAIMHVLVAPGGPAVLLVADDVQWCDSETLQFIHYLIRAAPKARLLIAATVRREEIDATHPLNELMAGLHALERVTEIEVGPLDADDTARLAGVEPGGNDAAQLYHETEGNALFVVETMRAGWKAGQPTRRTSPRVQAVIQSRLSRLSEPARDLAGVASTIGRAFTSDVLGHAAGLDGETLVRALDELWRRRIVREQASDAYDFTHDKIREAAYLALSPALRRRHHLHVARALERAHAGGVDVVSGQVAAHYDRAGEVTHAAQWYERAADVAQHLYANADAVRLLDRTLELVRRLPETPERAARELAIVTSLVVLLGWVEGFASSRVDRAQRQALELSRALRVELAPSLLRSTAMFSLSHERFEETERVGVELHARGVAAGDDVLVVEGEYVLGIAAFWRGRLASAREHFETAIARCLLDQVRIHLQRYGQDPRIICLSRLANTLWYLGQTAEAVSARDAALSMADGLGHPQSRVTALVFATMLALEMRDWTKLREYVIALAEPLAAPATKPASVATQAFSGFVDVLDGRAQHGVSRIRAALAEAEQGYHAPGNRSCIERVLVEALVEAREPRGGLRVVDHALGRGAGVRVFEAELRRQRAEFLAAVGATGEEVEAELARALAVAREQSARAIERRIETSMARLGRRVAER